MYRTRWNRYALRKCAIAIDTEHLRLRARRARVARRALHTTEHRARERRFDHHTHPIQNPGGFVAKHARLVDDERTLRHVNVRAADPRATNFDENFVRARDLLAGLESNASTSRQRTRHG